MHSNTINNQSSPSYSRTLKPTPTKKQAVLIPSEDDINLIEYVIGLGRIVGPHNIISASKISKKRICIYLDSEKTVNSFIETGGKIIVRNNKVEVRKLVAPSKRLILSNVHTCIPNSKLLEALRDMNIKTTSAIHDLHIGTTSTTIPSDELIQYKHISSFRRAVYYEETINVNLPNSFLIKFDNETFRIFLNDVDSTCHICGEHSHNSSQCTVNPQFAPAEADPTHSLEPSFEENLEAARAIRAQQNKVGNAQPDVSTFHSDMDVTQSPSKRPISESTDSITLSVSQSSNLENDRSKPKRKRKKKKSTKNATDPVNPSDNEISSSDNEHSMSDTPEESENPLKPLEPKPEAPLSEILSPAAAIFNDTTQIHPLTFQDLQEFIQQCSKTKNAPVVADDYTRDIPGLINLLNLCHGVVKDRNLKNRLTRIKNALEKPVQT